MNRDSVPPPYIPPEKTVELDENGRPVADVASPNREPSVAVHLSPRSQSLSLSEGLLQMIAEADRRVFGLTNNATMDFIPSDLPIEAMIREDLFEPAQGLAEDAEYDWLGSRSVDNRRAHDAMEQIAARAGHADPQVAPLPSGKSASSAPDRFALFRLLWEVAQQQRDAELKFTHLDGRTIQVTFAGGEPLWLHSPELAGEDAAHSGESQFARDRRLRKTRLRMITELAVAQGEFELTPIARDLATEATVEFVPLFSMSFKTILFQTASETWTVNDLAAAIGSLEHRVVIHPSFADTCRLAGIDPELGNAVSRYDGQSVAALLQEVGEEDGIGGMLLALLLSDALQFDPPLR